MNAFLAHFTSHRGFSMEEQTSYLSTLNLTKESLSSLDSENETTSLSKPRMIA
jgi:hypothetical protein